MESNPLISIIVPCYNIENKVSKCIESLIEQNYKKIEVICINDASTDNTLEILNSFQECDGRIRVINLAQNGGLANGRRVGVKEAFGEFIAFVDGDDWVKRDYIQTLYRAQRQSNCDVVICENYRQSFKHVSPRSMARCRYRSPMSHMRSQSLAAMRRSSSFTIWLVSVFSIR